GRTTPSEPLRPTCQLLHRLRTALRFARRVRKEEQVILGRERELGELQRFTASIPQGPSALLLEGVAGIGKTTIWLEAAAMARQADFRVLSARASESEARLSYAALGDLLEGVVDDVLPDLPAPQRRALEVALLRSDSVGAAPDQRAVSLATRTVLHALAASAPVVLAIDDVQWLDAPTARILSFVLRRLSEEPVALIATVRIGSQPQADPIDVGGAMAS